MRPKIEDRSEIPTKNNKGIVGKIVLVVVLIAVLALAVYGVFAFLSSPASSGSGELFLEIEDYPSTVKKPVYTLVGEASSSKYNATININGEFVKSIVKNNEKEEWSKELRLKKGKNTFLITIVNANGDSITETVEISCDLNVVYKEGTVLVKKNTSGVYVRPTPQISDKFVLLIDQNDYTSQFVCLGEESTDAEGYIWCKVRTPANGEGWVRSDLMRVLE